MFTTLQTNPSAHILYLRESQNVMQGVHNFIMKDSILYVAQNVCSLITALSVNAADFLSSWMSMNMLAGGIMIHSLFPRDQIKAPYLQVVRMFSTASTFLPSIQHVYSGLTDMETLTSRRELPPVCISG